MNLSNILMFQGLTTILQTHFLSSAFSHIFCSYILDSKASSEWFSAKVAVLKTDLKYTYFLFTSCRFTEVEQGYLSTISNNSAMTYFVENLPVPVSETYQRHNKSEGYVHKV